MDKSTQIGATKMEEAQVGSSVTLYDDAKGNKTGQRIAGIVKSIRGDKYKVVDANGFSYTVPATDFVVYQGK